MTAGNAAGKTAGNPLVVRDMQPDKSGLTLHSPTHSWAGVAALPIVIEN